MPRLAALALVLLALLPLAPRPLHAEPPGAAGGPAAPPAPAAPAAPAAPTETLLLQEPTIAAGRIVFVYAGDLWRVPATGGEALRLTSTPGRESAPALSPDGALVAYSAEAEGGTDVYVLPLEGGVPRRLTFHPERDRVLGWHPDGRRIAFASPRLSGPSVDKAFLVPASGGPVEALPLPEVGDLAFHPDGRRVAYTPWREAFRTWKRYRGGRTSPIWVTDLTTLATVEVPHVNASDAFPAWSGDTLWFASDREGRMDVFRWAPGAAAVERVTRHDDFDVRNLSAQAGPAAGPVVFEQAGALHVLEPGAAAPRRLSVRVVSDGLHAQPRWQTVQGFVRSGSVAPNGKRAAFEARGEILTLPREDGDARNLTESPGVHDRAPVWSPDGARLAWLADTGGEMALHVGPAVGRAAPTIYRLTGAGFYFDPQWSPDGKRVLFSDRANRLAFVTLSDGSVTEVARLRGSLGTVRPGAVWSPDGRWIAYEQRDGDTLYDRIALYELASGTSTVLTDGFATASAPCFSPDGRHLFFQASVDEGPRRFGLDLKASAARDGVAGLYVVVLAKDGRNPLAPRSDEGAAGRRGADGPTPPAREKEGGKEEGKDGPEAARDPGAPPAKEAAPAGPEELPVTRIDREGLGQRILALPLPAKDYGQLGATKDRLLLLEPLDDGGPVLKAFSFETKKAEELARGVTWFQVSGDGRTLLTRGPDGWALLTAQGKDRKRLAVEAVKVRVDPAAEWPQMLAEVGRLQRDFFYDPAMHGVDWPAACARWSAFLPHVRHRSDLNLLIGELIGELACGHQYVSGGEVPAASPGAGTGLLGADLAVEQGRWRLTRILSGQNWNPGLRAPLTEPGVNVRVGDYLLAVDGRPLLGAQNLLAAFEGTAERQVELTVNDQPGPEGARTVTVVPAASDRELRRRAWVEEKRALVDRLSGGRLAYIYMPDTGPRGLAAFTRDYFSQVDRQGLVLDERYNGGGKVADYVIDTLDDRTHCWWMTREGWAGRTPFGVLEGPKAMLINGYAGSGGDALPWLFRQAGLGPLVGTRTWGGLVGITGYPPLMDGGSVTAAAFGIMDPEGRWIIENEGVAPDVEVHEWPADCADGRDPTLEKAVALVLEALPGARRTPRPVYHPPAPR